MRSWYNGYNHALLRSKLQRLAGLEPIPSAYQTGGNTTTPPAQFDLTQHTHFVELVSTHRDESAPDISMESVNLRVLIEMIRAIFIKLRVADDELVGAYNLSKRDSMLKERGEGRLPLLVIDNCLCF